MEVFSEKKVYIGVYCTFKDGSKC